MKPTYIRAKTNLLCFKVQTVYAVSSANFLFSSISITGIQQRSNIDKKPKYCYNCKVKVIQICLYKNQFQAPYKDLFEMCLMN